MISFRYHVVTIVAVFLALGLGLLAGSSFGQPALVAQLRERTDAQLARIDELRAEADALDARNGSLEAFAAAATPFLIDGRLGGFRVVVVTQEGVEPATERSALESLADAGAEIAMTLSLQPTLVPTTPADAQALAALVGGSDPGTALAARLGVPVAPAAVDDLLVALVDGGFLATRSVGLDEAARSLVHGGSDLLVVVLGGAPAGEQPLATRGVASALVAALLVQGIPVAAAEGSLPADPWVDGLGGDALVTVVGLDDSPGGAALVLGLRDRVLTGRGGAYGTAAAPLP